MEEKKVRISRRDFLTGTGAAIGGLTAGSLIGYTAQAEAATGAGSFPFPNTAALSTTIDATGYSLGKQIKYRAIQAYKTMGGCCIGGWYGIAQALRDYYTQTGDTASLAIWNEVPDAMFKWGLGGGYNWGTVCGALNSTAFAAYAVAGSTVGGNIVNEVFQYYQDSLLPDSTNDTDYAEIFTSKFSDWAGVANGTTTTCGSPLCHASVSTWCDVNSAYHKDSTEKKKRCARVTADCAYKTAVLLAAHKSTTYTANWVYTAATNDCFDCHTGKVTSSNLGTSKQSSTGLKLDTEQGRMACEACHEDGGKNMAPKCTDAKAGIGNGEI